MQSDAKQGKERQGELSQIKAPAIKPATDVEIIGEGRRGGDTLFQQYRTPLHVTHLFLFSGIRAHSNWGRAGFNFVIIRHEQCGKPTEDTINR